MIKIKKNTLVVFSLLLLFIGLLIGIVTVNTVKKTSSSAAEYQSGITTNQPAEPYNVGGSCYNKCVRGGGNPILCFFGCLSL